MSIRAACGYLKKSENAFTLVELLLVIVIVAILSLVVMYLMNPQELARRSRDATRISDLEELQKNINIVLQESVSASAVLCDGNPPPCSGYSNLNGRNVDGSGWIKLDFTNHSLNIGVLPVDPINNGAYRYVYSADNQGYEINTFLESLQMADRMGKDGGDNVSIYEVGTKLNLLH